MYIVAALFVVVGMFQACGPMHDVRTKTAETTNYSNQTPYSYPNPVPQPTPQPSGPDTTAPVVTITAPADTAVINGVFTLRGTCESGLDYHVTGAGVLSSFVGVCGGGVFNLNMQLSAGGGSKQVDVWQVDLAGNIGQTSRTYNRDLTPPALTVNSPANNSIVGNTVTASGSCESPLPVVVTGNGVAATVNIPCNNNVFNMTLNISANDGAKVLNFTQTDPSNNVTTVTRNVTKDTTAPVVSIINPTMGMVVTTATVTVNGACETGISVVIDGAGVATAQSVMCTAAAYSATVSLKPLAVATTPENRQIDVSQTDAGGNQTKISVTVNKTQ